MRRTLVSPLVLLALVAALSVPAEAHHKAKHKPKAKQASEPVVERGSYQVRLRPEGCGHLPATVEGLCYGLTNGQAGPVPNSRGSHEFRFAGPGTFRASLTPHHTLQQAVAEWDVFLRLGNGTRQWGRPHHGSYELVHSVMQAPVTLWLGARNNSGWPEATVTWSYTYR